jgi:hypothetical protein
MKAPSVSALMSRSRIFIHTSRIDPYKLERARHEVADCAALRSGCTFEAIGCRRVGPISSFRDYEALELGGWGFRSSLVRTWAAASEVSLFGRGRSLEMLESSVILPTLLLLAGPAGVQPLWSRTTPPTQAIDTSFYVTLGGVQQYVEIHGAYPDLLRTHGLV